MLEGGRLVHRMEPDLLAAQIERNARSGQVKGYILTPLSIVPRP